LIDTITIPSFELNRAGSIAQHLIIGDEKLPLNIQLKADEETSIEDEVSDKSLNGVVEHEVEIMVAAGTCFVEI